MHGQLSCMRLYEARARVNVWGLGFEDVYTLGLWVA